MILPEHDVVVFDEAHGLEDIMSDTVGVQLARAGSSPLAAVIRRILDDPRSSDAIIDLAEVLREALTPHAGLRLPTPYPDELHATLLDAATVSSGPSPRIAAIDTPVDDAKQKKLRAQIMAGAAIELTTRPGAIGDHEGIRRLRRRQPAYPTSRSPRSTSARCCARASGSGARRS